MMPVRSRRRVAPLVPPPAVCTSVEDTFDRECCHAGSSPNTIPVTMLVDTATARTRALIAISDNLNRVGGSSAPIASTLHHAASTPRAAPVADSSRPSTSSPRVNTQREAPSAERTAISRARVVDRARTRLATFAHAMSNSMATDANSMRIAGPASPTSQVRNGITVLVRFSNQAG